jgi:hypothetical protein
MMTHAGIVWSEIVNELDWLQNERGDLSEAMVAIEDQLPAEYWDSEQAMTVNVSPAVAALIAEVVDQAAISE